MSTDGQPGKDTDGGDTVVWCWVEQPSGWQLICQLAKQLVRQSEKTVVTSAFCFLLFCQETIGKQTVKALPGFRLNNGALAVTQRTQWKWLPILAVGFCSIFWFPPPSCHRHDTHVQNLLPRSRWIGRCGSNPSILFLAAPLFPWVCEGLPHREV